jgi:hypothetical protein
VIVLVIIVVVLRRKNANQAPSMDTGAQPVIPVTPANPDQYNSAPVPPTPGSGDPFLTPMGQHQNLGASYFNGMPQPGSPAPLSGSASGTGSGMYASQYSGLPEPQQNDMSGGGMTAMPMPRYDSTHPHPLAMSIVHSQQPEPDNGGARPWSGYASGLPSPGANPGVSTYGGYAESNNTHPSGWTNPTVNSNMGYANQVPAGEPGPGRPPSTVYQATSHVGYEEPSVVRSPP